MTEDRPSLGGRYALHRPLKSAPGSDRFFGVDAETGKRVVVGLVDPGRKSTLLPARGIKHRHLAGVIDVIDDFDHAALPPDVQLVAGASAVIAEHVPGRTLREQLESGPMHPAKAVAWTVRLAEALQALHTAGAVHGAISPRSVIAEPAGRAISPVLSQLVAPPLGSFLPPERLKGAAESASDDVWGIYATLYAALTGSPLFSAPTRDALLKVVLSKPKPLSSFGIDDAVLQEILQRGLLPDRHARSTDLAELVESLDAWERDPTKPPPKRASVPRPGLRGLGDIVVGTLGGDRNDGIVIDDHDLPDDQGMDLPETASPQAVVLPLPAPQRGPAPRSADQTPMPAPPPAATAATTDAQPEVARESAIPAQPAAPPVKKRVSINPFERKGALWPWFVAAVVASGGVVYLVVAPEPPPPPKPAEPVREPPKPKPRPAPTVKRSPAEVRDSCVVAHFPPESIDKSASFDFVCQEGSVVDTARRLHDMVKIKTPAPLTDAGADASSEAGLALDVVRASNAKPLPEFVGLGLDWYELPATAIIRRTCCPGSLPVVLPETAGWCEQLQSVVRRTADDSQRSMDLAPAARAFDKAVTCLFANKTANPYPYAKLPTPANRHAFQQFLSRAAVIGTQR